METELDFDSEFDPENAQDTLESMLNRADKRLTEEMDEAGLNIEKEASQRSPVDTGNLRASWGYNLEASGILNSALELTVGNEAHYSPHVEFGTTKMDAQPMLRPAIDAESRRLMRRVRMAVIEAAVTAGGGL
jgi:HK97 gp10 family phage protein